MNNNSESKLDVIQLTLVELPFILIFLLILMIGNYSSENEMTKAELSSLQNELQTKIEKEEKLSNIRPGTKFWLSEIKIVGYNEYLIIDSIYTLGGILRKYEKIIANCNKNNQVPIIKVWYDKSLDLEIFDDSYRLLEQYFYPKRIKGEYPYG